MMNEGIYRVSKALVGAAGKYDGSWIQVKNESAKLLRSLVLPCAFLGTLFLCWRREWLGLSAIAAAFAFLFCYIQLKASHMADLYSLTEKLVKQEQYKAHDLTDNIRLFFWEGEQVSSGTRPTAKKITSANTGRPASTCRSFTRSLIGGRGDR